MDSLIRRYQEKEFVKLKEKEPELFQIPEVPSFPTLNKQLPPIAPNLIGDTRYTANLTNLPYFNQIPPTPIQTQEKFFDQQQGDRRFFQVSF